MARIPVGILGATGMVGQQFIALLPDHPWFEVKYLGASERSEGKKFRDAAAWRLANRLPVEVADRVVEAAKPGTAPKLVFSGLDSSVAGEIEASASLGMTSASSPPPPVSSPATPPSPRPAGLNPQPATIRHARMKRPTIGSYHLRWIVLGVFLP